MRKVAFVVLAALAAACSSGGGDDPAPPPPTGSLTLVNSSGVPIHEVYVSKSTDSSWGSQRNGSTVASGTSFTVNLEPALWDLMAIYSGTYSDYYTYAMNQNVTADATTTVYAYASGFTGSLEVVNDDTYYDRAIWSLYVTPANYAWGSDWLGTSTLPVGWSYEIQEVPPGYYDVWCEMSDGADYTAYDVLVSSLTLATVYCGY